MVLTVDNVILGIDEHGQAKRYTPKEIREVRNDIERLIGNYLCELSIMSQHDFDITGITIKEVGAVSKTWRPKIEMKMKR